VEQKNGERGAPTRVSLPLRPPSLEQQLLDELYSLVRVRLNPVHRDNESYRLAVEQARQEDAGL